MENKKFTIEEEIQKTLACIDKIERVSIKLWLPTQLKEKLKKEKGQSYRKGYSSIAFSLF